MNDIKVPPFTDGQKQIIKMTEKLAEKRGGKICDVDGIDDDIKDIKELLNDTIRRIEAPTNEDWLKSLDTEGLVDYLYEVHKGGNTVERQAWIEKHKERVKMQFRGWLKEKH